MSTTTRMSREEAAALLEVGPGRLRSLAREHPTSLGGRFRTDTMSFDYDRGAVERLARERGNLLPEGRLHRAEAAALLGVGIDRFNQLVRDDRVHLHHRRDGRGRATYSRVAVEALKRRREALATRRPGARGSARSVTTGGQQ